MATTNDSKSRSASEQPVWLKVVQQKVDSLQYGVVQIIVHDAKVVQVDRTERTRLEIPPTC